MTAHKLTSTKKPFRCSVCLQTWGNKPRSQCPGLPVYNNTVPNGLIEYSALYLAGLKLAEGQQVVGYLGAGKEALYTKAECVPHGIDITFDLAMAAAPRMAWDDWKNHPNWATVKQHKEKHLIPSGVIVAKVWYGNQYMKKRGEDGHYIPLYDLTQATEKPVSEAKRAALARANETKIRNQTCAICGKENRWLDIYGQAHVTKIKREPKLCETCYSLQNEVTEARAWLADPNAVILDTETRDLHDEVIDVAVLRACDGLVLMNTYVHPVRPIVEKLYRYAEDWNGDGYEKPTAYAIHGISNDMVRGAPYFTQIWPLLQTLLMFRSVLCYNAEYDYGCLHHDTYLNNFTSKVPGEWHCVMRFYSAYHGEWNYRRRRFDFISLTDACLMQDVDTSEVEAHSALGDCLRTRALLQAIAAKVAPLDKTSDFPPPLARGNE